MEGIPAEVENGELFQTTDFSRDGVDQIVVAENELLQIGKKSDFFRDRAAEIVLRQTQGFERGDVRDGGRDLAGEGGIGVESQVLQRGEREKEWFGEREWVVGEAVYERERSEVRQFNEGGVRKSSRRLARRRHHVVGDVNLGDVEG